MPRDRRTLIADLIETVRDMRSFQREYFNGRSPLMLNRAKDSEKRVDRLLEEIAASDERELF